MSHVLDMARDIILITTLERLVAGAATIFHWVNLKVFLDIHVTISKLQRLLYSIMEKIGLLIFSIQTENTRK